MSPRLRADKSDRRFAMVCGAWLVASLIIPALPLWDAIVLSLLLLTGGWSLPLGLWAIVPAVAVLRAARRLFERRYGSALGWFGVPLAGVVLFFLATDIGDAVRFRLNKASYDRIVAEAQADKCSKEMEGRRDVDGIDCDPITVIFGWGGFGPIWHGIVYDAGDEIMKPPQERSVAWKNRPIGNLLSCSGATRAFGGHYYRAGGSYAGGDNACG
jgi:hypothetical protein